MEVETYVKILLVCLVISTLIVLIVLFNIIIEALILTSGIATAVTPTNKVYQGRRGLYDRR